MVDINPPEATGPVILIVDDNPYNLQILGNLLKEELFSVEFATSGEGALEWLQKKSFDLVLLDINMPGMNGFEVCREIRGNNKYNNMPVIFLSANTERDSMLKGFEIGAQDYVTKPFDSRELMSRVKTHLKLKVTIEQLKDLNCTLEDMVQERTAQLKVANEKLEMLNEKLLDLDRAKSEFLNLISHEIRTPLNGMVGPIELIKESDCSADISALVNILDASVQRLEQFSVNALLITRLKTKPKEICPEDVHLDEIIDRVLADRIEKIQSKDIRIRVYTGTGNNIKAERELLKLCLRNVIDNAVKFSPPGSEVEIVTTAENEFINISVRDQGEGFNNQIMKEAFNIFSFGDKKEDNAQGLGLPLAKMIMEAHNGTIVLSNNNDRGARVDMKIPLS